MTTDLTPALTLAVERPATDWAGYLGWTAGLLLLVALVYWLMRRAWVTRGRRQADLPPLPTAPAAPDAAEAADGAEAAVLHTTGRYHGSTSAGQWLDRIIAHGLGTRSRAELTLTGQGLRVDRPGAQDFFVPAGQLRGARLDKAIAGKVLTEGGLLIITWEHGGRLLDSGFRSDRAAEHPDWVQAIEAAVSAAATGPATAAVPHHEEGAP
jgi:hypothetical protein